MINKKERDERRKKTREAAFKRVVERGIISCKLLEEEMIDFLNISDKYKVPAGILLKLLALEALPLLKKGKIKVESYIDKDCILHAKIVKNNDKKDQFFKELNEGYVNYYDI